MIRFIFTSNGTSSGTGSALIFRELSGVPFQPVGHVVPGVLLHVLAKELVDAFLEGDGLPRLHQEAGDVGLDAVHDDVAVGHDLAGGPDGPRRRPAGAARCPGGVSRIWIIVLAVLPLDFLAMSRKRRNCFSVMP